MSEIIKVKDKLYLAVNGKDQFEEWVTMTPLEYKERPTASHGWAGKKIPMDKVAQVLAFFEWSYAETKSESLVHWFYHPVHGWEPLVLPQKGHTGMTVSLIEGHPGAEEARARLPGAWNGTDPWDESFNIRHRMWSTWHHHCTGSAFASSVDDHDELTKEGLHVTIGGISTGKYSIHARTTYDKVRLDAELTDWFELEDIIRDRIPADLHAEIIKRRLITPPVGVEFPEWWKANVIKVERVWNQGHYSASNDGLPYSHNCTYHQGGLRYNWTSKEWERWDYNTKSWLVDKTRVGSPASETTRSSSFNQRYNGKDGYWEKWDGPNGWTRDWDRSPAGPVTTHVPRSHSAGAVDEPIALAGAGDDSTSFFAAFEKDIDEVLELWDLTMPELLKYMEDNAATLLGDMANVMAEHNMGIEEICNYLEGWIREEREKADALAEPKEKTETGVVPVSDEDEWNAWRMLCQED